MTTHYPQETIYRWEELAHNPENISFIMMIQGAPDTPSLNKVKRVIIKAQDSGQSAISDGMLDYFVEKRKEELRVHSSSSSSDPKKARANRILRTRDSSGRAKARRW